MSVLELYIEKDVEGGSMFHSVNFVPSCGNNLSNNVSELSRNVSNLHDDEDDDYVVSNSYVEESLDEDDSVDGMTTSTEKVFRHFQWRHLEKLHCSLCSSATFCTYQPACVPRPTLFRQCYWLNPYVTCFANANDKTSSTSAAISPMPIATHLYR
ncbi:hypothetical protein GmHk_03G007276 [Glycine max]|nr:hypothetical protein GmHk_03G007276 [Glycine max]